MNKKQSSVNNLNNNFTKNLKNILKVFSKICENF